VLEAVLAGARGVLRERFVGMYLHGSLATGDFNHATSDIDFVVVTDDELPDAVVAALGEMHVRLASSNEPWAAHLEGSYIPRAAMRRYIAEAAHHPRLPIGEPFSVAHHHADWVIERHVLREQGIVLAGPEPRTFIDPVTKSQLREAVVEIVTGFWAQQLVADDFLRPREYQAFAVLTMCRALYTLACGEMVSKPAAARWAISSLEAPWPAVIARALAWPNGVQSDGLDETRALIRYTLTSRAETSRW
jgi:hypothetical protein